MSTENTGSVSVTVVSQENQTFLNNDSLKLKKLQVKLNKAALDALDVLVSIMETTQDDKLKAQCAKDIVQLTINTNKDISQDQMQRLIAEIKLNRGGRSFQIPLDEDDERQKPAVTDFSTIRSIG